MLSDHVGSSLGDLAVLVRLHPRYADCADHLATSDDGHAAFRYPGVEGWHSKPDAAASYGILEHLGRAAKLSGGSCFLFRDAN